MAPPPVTRARDLGEHSARGRYVGQHVPTEATRHQQGTRPSKTGKDRDQGDGATSACPSAGARIPRGCARPKTAPCVGMETPQQE